MNNTIFRLLAGFIAGALAVLVFHQGMYLILVQTGLLVSPPPPRPPNTAWSMTPTPFWPDFFKTLKSGPVTVPRLVNLMFWGGVWGIIFAMLYDRIGALPGWLKGILFGMIGPMLLGGWVFFAYLRGEPMMVGLVPQRLLIGFLLNGLAFGLGLGLLYPMVRGMLGGART